MFRSLTIIAALVALAVPAATLADDAPTPANQSTAQQRCRDQLKSMSTKDFHALYGTNANGKNAFGKCVSQKAKAQSQDEEQATENAAKACKAERANDASAFADKYGKTKHAFGKCVSSKVKQK